MTALPHHPRNISVTWVDHVGPAADHDAQTATDRQFPVVVDGVRPSSRGASSKTLRWSNT